MRMSDWSSDVCSSDLIVIDDQNDLAVVAPGHLGDLARGEGLELALDLPNHRFAQGARGRDQPGRAVRSRLGLAPPVGGDQGGLGQIGRTTCRGGVVQDVWIRGVAVSDNKKKET